MVPKQIIYYKWHIYLQRLSHLINCNQLPLKFTKRKGVAIFKCNYLREFNLLKYFNVTLPNVVEMTRVANDIVTAKGEIYIPSSTSYQWENSKNKCCLTPRASFNRKRITNEERVKVKFIFQKSGYPKARYLN